MSDDESSRRNGGLIEQTCIIVNKSTDPQTDKATGNPVAAMCVRKSSVRRVLQFTPFIGASSVLHRPASRVIHRLQLYCFVCLISFKDCSSTGLEGAVLKPIEIGKSALFALRRRVRTETTFSLVLVHCWCFLKEYATAYPRLVERLEERVLLLVQLREGR
jgi:hypothetical protein